MEKKTDYTPQELTQIHKAFDDLLASSYQKIDKQGEALIKKAFDVALKAHDGQRRKSGEPYIFHPIAVAKIVAQNIGLGATSIASALLHDTVEDTSITHDDIYNEFGQKISRIVRGLTKIKQLKSDNKDLSLQAENFRKMILTLNEDVRVILIKIADRLHNMQTMDSMPKHKQEKIASETLYIYAPLAHKLGLYNIKTELEDLGLKYTEPEIYKEIANKIEESKEEQDLYIETFKNIIKDSLKKEGLNVEILGRFKSIFSIYRKMRTKKVSFEEVYDKFAIRIVYKSDRQNEKFLAWKIYSIVTDHFKPNPSRLRDWISHPKSTGYEALHTTVMGPEKKWVEVQIRSERMNEIAEKGYAAHYKYKHGSDEEIGIEVWLNKLKELLETQSGNAVDFIEEFKLNLYTKEIFVLTPNGDVISLPKNATPLDFAYAIHTDVGSHCRGAMVNGKLVQLNYRLQSGDVVKIITSPSQKPKRNWLDFAVTGRAKSKIKSYLKQEQKEIVEEGKEILQRKLKQLKIKFNESTVNELVSYFKLKTSKDLFYNVGAGIIDNKMLKNFANARSNVLVSFFKKKLRRKPSHFLPEKEDVTINYDTIVFGPDEQQLDYTLANCCNPIPGDEIFGFTTINEGIKVHKKSCPNALSLHSNYAYRILSARWIDSTKHDFIVYLKISGFDRPGMAKDITRLITDDEQLVMKNVNLKAQGGIFEGEISVYIKNTDHLKQIIKDLKGIEGVKNVQRIEQF
jgi:GTP pyrophosphokinase